MTDNPTPTPAPTPSPTPSPGPTPTPSPGPTPTPGPTPRPHTAATPASVSGDVPIDAWKASLAAAADAPAAERHDHLNTLLGELDAQVGSL